MEDRIVKGIWFPIEIWENKSLTWNEKILLMEIDSYTSKERDCFISNEYISNLLNVTETSANKILSSLISKGYVEKTKFDGRKRYIKSCLHEVKAELPESANQGCSKVQGWVAPESNIPNTYTDNNIPKEEKKGTIVPKKEINFSEIKDYWNENTKSFSKLKIISSKMKSAINSRIRDGYTIDDIKKVILLCESLPDFYKGKEKGKSWKADFYWIMANTNGNFDKIISGTLHNSPISKQSYEEIMNSNNEQYKSEYHPPVDGMSLQWHEPTKSYLSYYAPDSSMFFDGYSNENRPDGAIIYTQGVKYTWSMNVNKWIKNNE